MKWLLRLIGGLLAVLLLAVVAIGAMGLRPGAGTTRVDIEIARPPEVVWTWISQPEQLKKWVSWLVEVRHDTPGVTGVGARETWFMDDPHMKERLEIPSQVTAYDPPRSVSVHISLEKMFEGDVTYTLTPTATGTRLEQLGTWRYTDPFARFMEPLVTPEANAKGRTDFARLKALVEAG